VSIILDKQKYLDIHTHVGIHHSDVMSVSCLSAKDIFSETTHDVFNSAGIHPWWAEDYTVEEIDIMKSHILSLVEKKQLWAIGETGIDRSNLAFLEQQKDLFNWHVDLSEKFCLPLVIHSVRAGADFLQIIKHKKPTSAWIFHDFRGNDCLMKDLLRLHSKCYFSFGISIDNSPQIRELLTQVPLANIFLETDDQKHLSIHDIYLRAASILNLDVDFLKAQIWFNFSKIDNMRQ
jgi:TatD DNase family protein